MMHGDGITRMTHIDTIQILGSGISMPTEAQQRRDFESMFGNIFENTPIAPKKAILSDKETAELITQSKISEDYNKCAEYLVRLVELAIWEKMQ